MANYTSKGFTLVELMIAVAVVGILAAIAIPSYQESLKKSRRSDAQASLMNFANAMERHFTETSTYCDVGTEGGDVCGDTGMDLGPPSNFAPTGKTGEFYNFVILTVDGAPDADTYTLQAIPIGAQAGDGVMELDQDGQRRWDKNNNTAFEAEEMKWE
jgi:type IV pilus assembly protein PilE